jgi:hypothetical protein
MRHDSQVTPFRSQIEAPTGNHQQPDTEAKPLISEPDAKPFYLELAKRDELGPAVNPSSVYVKSGVFTTDPRKYSGQLACPIDGTPLALVGSQHGAWRCVGQGHQFDSVNTAPQSWYVCSPTLPAGPVSDPLGNQNL